MSTPTPDEFTGTPVDRPRQPRVGDVLDIRVGHVTVTAVYRYGLRLQVRDRLGRTWYPERAPAGCWVRIRTAGR